MQYAVISENFIPYPGVVIDRYYVDNTNDFTDIVSLINYTLMLDLRINDPFLCYHGE